MAHPAINIWLDAVMRVQSQWRGEDTGLLKGTGFLVARPVSKDGVRVFLITNKHVISRDENERSKTTEITLHVNMQMSDGPVCGNAYTLTAINWREHPEAAVDIFAVDVTFLANDKLVKRAWADYNLFATDEKIRKWQIGAGDDVLTMGYPGIDPEFLQQGRTNYALVRQGIISTQIGHTFTRRKKGNIEEVVRGFLIDGATVHGSSGSPVILRPMAGRHVDGKIQLRLPPPLLLGIVAETTFTEHDCSDHRTFIKYAGMGMAHDALAIQEVVELFF